MPGAGYKDPWLTLLLTPFFGWFVSHASFRDQTPSGISCHTPDSQWWQLSTGGIITQSHGDRASLFPGLGGPAVQCWVSHLTLGREEEMSEGHRGRSTTHRHPGAFAPWKGWGSKPRMLRHQTGERT